MSKNQITPEIDDLTAINRAMGNIDRVIELLESVAMPYGVALDIHNLLYEAKGEMMGERMDRKKYRPTSEMRAW